MALRCSAAVQLYAATARLGVRHFTSIDPTLRRGRYPNIPPPFSYETQNNDSGDVVLLDKLWKAIEDAERTVADRVARGEPPWGADGQPLVSVYEQPEASKRSPQSNEEKLMEYLRSVVEAGVDGAPLPFPETCGSDPLSTSLADDVRRIEDEFLAEATSPSPATSPAHVAGQVHTSRVDGVP